MKFLLDEDVPVKLIRTLTAAGHDARRVAPATPDPTVAVQAREEGRILVTLDNDFANTALYPPRRFTIVHVKIHPPYGEDIAQAVTRLLNELPTEAWKGLIVLWRTGSLRILE